MPDNPNQLLPSALNISPMDDQNQPIPMRPPDTTTQPPMAPSPQPSPVTSQPTQSASPTNAAPASGSPTAAAQPAKPKSFFDRALIAMSGGERHVTMQDPNDPTKTITVAVPASRATLGQHILAGVLSGVFAGMKAGGEAPHPAGSAGPAIGAAASAGFNAAEQSRKEFQNAPQAQYDQMKARAVSTLKSNLELRNAMVNNAHLEDQYRKQVVDENKPLVQAIDDYDLQTKDPQKRVVVARGLTAEQAMAHNEKVMLGQNAIIDNYVPTGRKNADGTPEFEPTYMLINPYAKVLLTDALKEQYGQDYPALKQASDNALVDARYLVQLQNNRLLQTNAEGILAPLQRRSYLLNKAGTNYEGYDPNADVDSKTLSKIDPRSLLKGIDNPAEQTRNRKIFDGLAQVQGLEPDTAINMLKAAGASPQFISNVESAIGYNPQQWSSLRDYNKTETHAKATGENKQRATQVVARGADGKPYITNQFDYNQDQSKFDKNYATSKYDPKATDTAVSGLSDVITDFNRARQANDAYEHAHQAGDISNAQVQTDKSALANYQSVTDQIHKPEIAASINALGVAHMDVPQYTTDQMNALKDKQAASLEKMSQAARQKAIYYDAMVGSMPAYVRVVSRTGRSSETQLQSEVNQIPLPQYSHQVAEDKFNSFGMNIKTQYDQIPVNHPNYPTIPKLYGTVASANDLTSPLAANGTPTRPTQGGQAGRGQAGTRPAGAVGQMTDRKSGRSVWVDANRKPLGFVQ